MHHTLPKVAADPCVLEDVRPLLTELQTAIRLRLIDDEHPRRLGVERFIRDAFRCNYGAELNSFHPTLLSFDAPDGICAAVGYRDGRDRPLFSEQYLPAPADALVAGRVGRDIRRTELVEVGNLAISAGAEARWLIAAVTVFLHELGYRWVLFTAVKPLFNAFRRLGLNPIELAEARAEQLPDGGRNWGRYYDGHPMVCAGNIASGYHKLRRHLSGPHPALGNLLEQAVQQARAMRTPAHCQLEELA